MLLSHAHLDHSGYLPALVKAGYKGPIYCTHGTAELLKILLPDSAHLQEEDADYANRKGFSKHHPAEPLYTMADAQATLKKLRPVDWEQSLDLGGGIGLRYRRAGHIIGAASVYLSTPDGVLGFSGDLGRPHDLIMLAPEPPAPCDWLICESTYGNRRHSEEDAATRLAEAVSRCAARGGVSVLPAFAVGRAQLALHLLVTLRAAGRIPNMPIFLNSPMAIKATRVMLDYPEEHRLSPAQARALAEGVICVESMEDSIALNRRAAPHIIVSASGMATGGRVLHHLKTLLPKPRHQVIFLGFQAPGTRGDSLLNGAESVKIHGEYIPVKAEIVHIDALSAHADQLELLSWLGRAEQAPRELFITHGEPAAADTLRLCVQDRLGWRATVPEHMEKIRLHRE